MSTCTEYSEDVGMGDENCSGGTLVYASTCQTKTYHLIGACEYLENYSDTSYTVTWYHKNSPYTWDAYAELTQKNSCEQRLDAVWYSASYQL